MLITKAEAARILGISEPAIQKWKGKSFFVHSGTKIMIDTNNFMTKTGVRTFEAAAYLRRNGADVTRVRKLFRDDVVAYKARAEAVRASALSAAETKSTQSTAERI